MKETPPIRRDKHCARRGCKAKLPELAILRRDPFCTARCAKLFYGVEYKSDQMQKSHGDRTDAQKRMIDNSVRRTGGARPKYA